MLLGHNDSGGSSIYGQLDLIMSYLRKTERVVFVTIKEWQPGHATTNRAIRALPKTYPNVVVADWSAVLDANPQFLVDNVHPNSAGQIALANLIAIMLGPCRRDGSTVPPLKILPIPDGVDLFPEAPIPGITVPGGSTTTVPVTTTEPATTTTTGPPVSTTTTSPTTSAPTTSSSAPTTTGAPTRPSRPRHPEPPHRGRPAQPARQPGAISPARSTRRASRRSGSQRGTGAGAPKP